MKQIIEFISHYGFDTLLIAIVTTIVTGLIKLPIKKLARRAKNSHAITRFITFLPVVIGFGVTVLEAWLVNNAVPFYDEAFYIQWLSSVSVSLAIYAFWEKFFPSKSKILSEAEIEDNKELVDELKQIVEHCSSTPSDSNISEPMATDVVQKEDATESNNSQVSTPVAESRAEKIILSGGSHVQVTKES